MRCGDPAPTAATLVPMRCGVGAVGGRTRFGVAVAAASGSVSWARVPSLYRSGRLAARTGSARVGKPTFIAPGLLAGAQNNPNQKIHVIIQSSAGVADATNKIKGLGATVRRQLTVIGAVAVDITAGKLSSLSKQTGLTITADAPVRLSGTVNYSTQLWPYASGVALGCGYPLP